LSFSCSERKLWCERFSGRLALPISILATVAGAACSGQINPGGSNDRSTPDNPHDAPDAPDDGPDGRDAEGTVLPLRLLTSAEYRNTVSDILKVPRDLDLDLPSETGGKTAFAQTADLDDVGVRAYLEASEAVSAAYFDAHEALEDALGCIPAKDGDGQNKVQDEIGEACTRTFVTKMARRLYRRPLGEAETEAHLAFFHKTLRQELRLNAQAAYTGLLAALLTSPHFLYRWEQGWAVEPAGDSGQAQTLRLADYHLASQLSFALWASAPDEELLDAAAQGRLRNADGLRKEIQRLLDDERLARSLSRFHQQWLGVQSLPSSQRNPGIYPNFSPQLARAMQEQLDRYVADAMISGDGHLNTLLTSNRYPMTAELAAVYGTEAPTSNWQAASLPKNERRGLFTLAAFLTAHSDENDGSPISRGKFIREELMCDHIPPPPGDVPELPRAQAGLSKKQRFEQHNEGACNACHRLMDPLGFAFERFDGMGAHRELYRDEQPIETSGVVTNLDGEDRSFANAHELIELLGESNQVRDCFATQWFRYLLFRKDDTSKGSPDAVALEGFKKRFAEADGSVPELLLEMLSSRALTHRRLAPGESSLVDLEATP